MPQDIRSDPDANKGAVESSKPGSDNQVSVTGQLPHRDNQRLGGADSDFPEPGAREEHSGEGANTASAGKKRSEPEVSQKTNQNQQKEDPLAS